MKGRGFRRAALLLLCALAAAMASPAWAKKHKKDPPDIRGEQQREAAGRCPGFSLDQAIAQAERKYKGARVVRTDVVNEGGQCVYVLRLLSEERVWTVRVDSRSGGL